MPVNMPAFFITNRYFAKALQCNFDSAWLDQRSLAIFQDFVRQATVTGPPAVLTASSIGLGLHVSRNYQHLAKSAKTSNN